MIETYLKRPDLGQVDVRYVFSAGDLVLMRQRQPHKTVAKSMGPYKFVEYRGANRLVATIRDNRGKLIETSVANLLPYRGGVDLVLPSEVMSSNKAWYAMLGRTAVQQFDSDDDDVTHDPPGGMDVDQ